MPDTLNVDQRTALYAQWQAEERDVWITLDGGSMIPTILPGTRLCLRCSHRLPLVGEIVACRQGSALIVHRLLEITGPPNAPEFICRGDGNILPDAPVPAGAVVGVITQIAPRPFAKRVRFALRHPRRHARFLLRRLIERPPGPQ